jgi:hypothetical protein
MAIEQKGIVDIISIPPDSHVAALIISDHLPWDNTVGNHALLLQEKINEYVGFIESGSIYEARPDLIGRRLIIKVIAKYALSPEGVEFVAKAKDFLASAGFVLLHEVRDPDVVTSEPPATLQ